MIIFIVIVLAIIGLFTNIPLYEAITPAVFIGAALEIAHSWITGD